MSKAVTAVSTTTVSEYRNLPLAQLQESPTNPRRRFDEHSLNELAESFKSQGVLQPLLVRAIDTDMYQIVAGARRYRAAKIAALDQVPVRVVALSDAACVEAQLVENIQREGVHPLEEALAFHALLHTEGLQYDIHSLAAKAGKSPAFIATRLKLVELLPSIAEAFLGDQIGVGHALEIGKLPQAQQERAFDAAFREVWNGSGHSRLPLSLRDFTAWIQQNILLSLDRVPFDKADATLVPEAGSCAECPKRTGFNTLLFGELSQQDQCSDAACLNHKVEQFVARQIEAKPKLVQISTSHAGRVDDSVLPRSRYIALHLAKPAKAKGPLSPYEKPCKHMAEAIVVEGAERGHTTKVCAEPTCPVHFPGGNNKATNEAQLAKEREQRRKELEKQKTETTVRYCVLAAVLRKVGAPLDRADLALVARAMLEKMEPLRREALARRHKLVDGSKSTVTFPQVQKELARLFRQLDEIGLSKLLVEMALLGSVESASLEGSDALSTAARRHRVDVAKMRKDVETDLSAKQAKAKAKQKKAASAKPVKAAKAA
jgi:ParB family transcriptional regulator, chromosome partitioning protein